MGRIEQGFDIGSFRGLLGADPLFGDLRCSGCDILEHV